MHGVHVAGIIAAEKNGYNAKIAISFIMTYSSISYRVKCLENSSSNFGIRR